MGDARKRATEVARSMLTGDLDLVEGSRRLHALALDLDMQVDSTFLVFVGVASQADEWPPIAVRQNFSQRMLTRADAEKNEYLACMRSTILAACREVIEKLV